MDLKMKMKIWSTNGDAHPKVRDWTCWYPRCDILGDGAPPPTHFGVAHHGKIIANKRGLKIIFINFVFLDCMYILSHVVEH